MLSKRSAPVAFSLMMFAVLIPCALGAAPNGARVFDIPKLPSITIDGKADDWGDGGFRVDAMTFAPQTPPPAPANFSPTFRLGWNDKGLLVLVDVTDNIGKESRDFFAGFDYDNIQLGCSTVGKDPVRCEMLVRPGMDPEFPDMWQWCTSNGTPMKEGDCQIARQKTPKGYRVEALIAWSELKTSPSQGTEFDLQMRVADRDAQASGPQDKSTIAAWYPAWEGPIAGGPANRIRLASKASSPILAAVSFSYLPGGLPWVSITGDAAIAGQPVRILQGDREIATGETAKTEDRAACSVLLPAREKSEPYGKLTVALGKETLGEVNFEKAVTKGEIAVQAESLATQDGKYTVRIRPSLAGTATTSASCRVQVFSTRGKRVARAKCGFGESAEFSLEPGLYRATAETENFDGYALEGESWLAATDTSQTAVHAAIDSARRLRDTSGLDAYAGWFDYLASKLETKMAAEKSPSPATVRLAFDLQTWIDRVQHDSKSLGKVRGLCEWAYRSKTDGTGQPFGLFIPTAYNPKQSYPLEIYLHGNAWTHTSSLVLEANLGTGPGFQLRVLGRAPGSGYLGLGERDVLEAIAYVRSHWNIDPSRIQIFGESMGGWGTSYVGARHPDLFSSARPLCGFPFHLENLLNVPVYALHSKDDGMAPITGQREGYQFLDTLGAEAGLYETNGYNHGVWNDREGFMRAQAWADATRRPWMVRRVRYTATDESARGAYWANVEEWGPEPRPARFDVRIGENNALYATLDNVGCLKIDLAAAPVNRRMPLFVSINGKIDPLTSAPLPSALYICPKEDGFSVSASAPVRPAERLHFPGGAMALYHGEPILIVWGTRGNAEMREKIHAVAQIARRSPTAAWPKTDAITRDGLLNHYTTYGLLPGKPDTEVTREDMAKYNLVLIGDADQNSVAADLMGKLPVEIRKGKIVAADGPTWDYKGRALGLLHYNPLQRDRLIYWVASGSPSFYSPGAPLMDMQGSIGAPDLVVTDADAGQAKGGVVRAARCFDSRWRWEPGYADSPMLSNAAPGTEGWAARLCRVMQKATGADLALMTLDLPATSSLSDTSPVRKMDVVAMEGDTDLLLVDVAGKRMTEILKNLKAEAGERPVVSFPALKAEEIDPQATYAVVMPAYFVGESARVLKFQPERFRFPNESLRAVLVRCLR